MRGGAEDELLYLLAAVNVGNPARVAVTGGLRRERHGRQHQQEGGHKNNQPGDSGPESHGIFLHFRVSGAGAQRARGSAPVL